MAKKPRENEVGTGHAGEMLGAEESRTVGEWAGSGGAGGTVLNPDAPDINTGTVLFNSVDEERREAAERPTPRNDATTAAKTPKKTIEEKRADFSRLASARVSRAIDALNALNHLASTQSYAWDVAMRDKIFRAIREKMDNVEQSFIAAETPTEGRKKTSKQLSFRV